MSTRSNGCILMGMAMLSIRSQFCGALIAKPFRNTRRYATDYIKSQLIAPPTTFTSKRCLSNYLVSYRHPFGLAATVDQNDNEKKNPTKQNITGQILDMTQGSFQNRSYVSSASRYLGPLVVPKTLTIPVDDPSIEFSFVRSSGAGGQNVNKVNSQAQLRMHIPSATWLPDEVRDRIKQREHNRVNKEGFLVLSSQEHRSQSQNKAEVLQKLKDICMECYPRPKVRKFRIGPTKSQKEKRLQDKKLKSRVKEERRRVL